MQSKHKAALDKERRAESVHLYSLRPVPRYERLYLERLKWVENVKK